jgi:hypothetical protein
MKRYSYAGSKPAWLALTALACMGSPDPSADTAKPTSRTPDTAAPVAASPAAPADTTPAPPTPKPAEPPSALAVTARGLGPLQAGMTIAQARTALNGALIGPKSADTSSCGYVQWRGGPPGVRIMTASGRIARIDVGSGTLATAAGARIGDSEQLIDSLYAGRVATTPHKYTKGGHYLTVTPPAGGDSEYRIVFETDGKRVTAYRAGKRPEVEYVEGCG